MNFHQELFEQWRHFSRSLGVSAIIGV